MSLLNSVISLNRSQFKRVLDQSEDPDGEIAEAIVGSGCVFGSAAGRKLSSKADKADVKAAGLLFTAQWSAP